MPFGSQGSLQSHVTGPESVLVHITVLMGIACYFLSFFVSKSDSPHGSRKPCILNEIVKAVCGI